MISHDFNSFSCLVAQNLQSVFQAMSLLLRLSMGAGLYRGICRHRDTLGHHGSSNFLYEVSSTHKC